MQPCIGSDTILISRANFQKFKQIGNRRFIYLTEYTYSDLPNFVHQNHLMRRKIYINWVSNL